jgi:DNA-binding MarR family transcriptional regulator
MEPLEALGRCTRPGPFLQVADALSAALRCVIHRSPHRLLHDASLVADRLFQAYGLRFVTPRQLAVLLVVAEDEGINATIVTERTGIDRTTTGQVVQRLARSGLLRKRRHRQDARALTLRLTEEGRQILAVAEPVARNVDEVLLAALPPARREPFLRALRTVVRALEWPRPTR